METTLVLLKPDCVKRALMGEIISRIERKGLRIVGMKMMVLDEATAREHYRVHEGKHFFDELIRFITSGPLVALAVRGPSAVRAMRNLLGVTDGVEALPGTIRGDYTTSISFNLVHASDSLQTAARELRLFFREDELHDHETRHEYHSGIDGFTVVELLVVVVILMLLMGLGAYWMGKARYNAKLVTSQRNLEAIGQMIANYASDHRGALPRPADAGLADASNDYGTKVFTSPDPDNAPYIGDKLFPRYCSDPRLFYCPLSSLVYPADLWKRNDDNTWDVPKGVYWSYTYLGRRKAVHTDEDVVAGRVLAETCSLYGRYTRTGDGEFDRETVVLYSDYSVRIEPRFKW